MDASGRPRLPPTPWLDHLELDTAFRRDRTRAQRPAARTAAAAGENVAGVTRLCARVTDVDPKGLRDGADKQRARQTRRGLRESRRAGLGRRLTTVARGLQRAVAIVGAARRALGYRSSS
jgi:hypothetical protein